MATKDVHSGVHNVREKRLTRYARQNLGHINTQEDELKGDKCEDDTVDVTALKLRLQEKENAIRTLTRERDEALNNNRALHVELECLKKEVAAHNTTANEKATDRVTRSHTRHDDGDKSNTNHIVIGRRKDRYAKTAITVKEKQSDNPPSPALNTSSQVGFLDSITERIEQVIDSRLRENLAEGKIEERLKRERAQNLIIHGLKQQSNKSDNDLVKKIFDIVEVPYTVKSIMRLGKAKPRSTQPMKVVMNTVREKHDFMKKLYKLKDADPPLRKVSITNDHTITERKEIATWIEKAKQKTSDDADGNIWKVRGSPCNRLRLVKAKISTLEQPTNSTTTNQQRYKNVTNEKHDRVNRERFIEA